MSPTDFWDESTPTDVDLASQGDDEIRLIKRALTERLGELIQGWPNDEPENLRLVMEKLTPTMLVIDEFENRPFPPTSFLFWASDQNRMFVSIGEEWFLLGGIGKGIDDQPLGAIEREIVSNIPVGTGAELHSVAFLFGDTNFDRFLVLDTRLRAKLQSEQFFPQISLFTFSGDTFLGTVTTERKQLGFQVVGADVTVYLVGIREVRWSTTVAAFIVLIGVNNNEASAQDISVEVRLRLVPRI